MHQVEAMVCGLLEEAHELGVDCGALTGKLPKSRLSAAARDRKASMQRVSGCIT